MQPYHQQTTEHYQWYYDVSSIISLAVLANEIFWFADTRLVIYS